MSVDTETDTAQLSPERAVARRFSRTTVLVLAVAFGLTAVGGYFAPRAYDWMTLGKSANSIAKKVGCTGFTEESQHADGTTKYQDAGSCVLNGARLNIVTFASSRDGSVFDQLLALRVQNNLAKGRTASFASGRGWNITEASFTRTVAQDVVKRMGSGVVNRVRADSNAKAVDPTPSVTPSSGTTAK
jgi:hypothetical protein